MLSIKDIRLPQVRKIIQGIVGKSDLQFSNFMITGDNNLVIIIRETVMYLVKLFDVPCLPPIAFSYENLEQDNLEEDECIPNQYLLSVLSPIYEYYINSKSYKLASELDLRNNNEFEQLLSLKAADGANFFKINGSSIGECYFIPIFSGFPNINKSDKIGIDIYDLKDGHLLIIMNIYKKKINRDIQMYFRTINLGKVS